MRVVKVLPLALTPSLSRCAGEGRFVVQMGVTHLTKLSNGETR